jgi:deoxyribose-phosphate aldolase
MEELLLNFPIAPEVAEMQSHLEAIKADSLKYADDNEALQRMFGAIDLTTLNTSDSADSVRAFVDKVNNFAKDYPSLRNVGGICVYPVFAPVLKQVLKQDNVYKAVVAACFPSSQTFTDVKCMEVRKAVEFGANEIDVVISVGEMLEGNHEFVYQEIVQIKVACGEARLKVILETGTLATPENIWNASILAMEAGADMIKTSTGKNGVGATPEAAFVMCQAIKAFAAKNGRKVGFKPAGGVQTVEDACYYYNIVQTILGDEWQAPEMFRIGASRLANALLSRIVGSEVKYF